MLLVIDLLKDVQWFAMAALKKDGRTRTVVSVSASERTTCCVQGSGRVWQWGNGMLSPTRVVFPNPWFELSKETAEAAKEEIAKEEKDAGDSDEDLEEEPEDTGFGKSPIKTETTLVPISESKGYAMSVCKQCNNAINHFDVRGDRQQSNTSTKIKIKTKIKINRKRISSRRKQTSQQKVAAEAEAQAEAKAEAATKLEEEKDQYG